MPPSVRSVLAALSLLSVAAAGAQEPIPRSEVVWRTPGDSVENGWRAYLPAGRARAILFLIPGFPADVNAFDSTGSEPSTLPSRLATRGIATVVVVPLSRTLYVGEPPLRRLDSLVADARRRYAVAGAPVVIGGFSAGGTGAIRFAERCAAGACGGNPPVAGVFAVDAPLDFARVWRADTLALTRRAPRANAAEMRFVLGELRQGLGGAPERFAAAYLRAAPLSAGAVDGGNARFLRATPLRAYTEPDVQWWIENRDLDYTAMNATDLAALVNLLRIGGNARATLITTTGRGMRAGGVRHPHSWSIVDEGELERWIVEIVGRRGS